MIEIRHLTKHYGSKTALSDLSLTLDRGEIIGLFGENGAGKTTLLKSILTLLPYQGHITLDGEPITRKNIARLSFATCEHSFFPDLSPAAHADFYREHFPSFRQKRFDGLMDFFSLPLHRPVRSFSTGQQNQFEVIMSLSQGADYILMDEPFAGNDLFNREDFYKLLAGLLEPNETLLLSTHLIREVDGFVSRALLLHDGQLIKDAFSEDWEEEGCSLEEFVKKQFDYRADRVSWALDRITGEDDHA